jgi:hypothetical protein
MTDGTPEDELVEEAEPLLAEPDPEEYEPDAGAQSTDTGTVYEGQEGDREPAATPHDDDQSDDGTAG